MRTFNPFAFAIVFTLFTMGILGGLVLLPIVFINWTWNSLVAHYTVLPQITPWQACLLYIACACALHILGLRVIRIKVKRVE